MKAKIFFIILLSYSFAGQLFASHLRGGEISAKLINCHEGTYRIELILFTDLFSSVSPGEGTLTLGDGTSVPVPILPVEILNEFLSVGIAKFEFIHSYTSPGKYIISYNEVNRNSGILNVPASTNVPFHIESMISILNNDVCFETVSFNSFPIDRACSGVTFFHNPAVSSSAGDSISYAFVVPMQSANTSINNFRFPIDPSFYIGMDYNLANETQNGPPVFLLDSITGNLVWNSPGMQGEYIIAIKTSTWRMVEGEWIEVAYITRDFQILVEDCDNTRPDIHLPEEICVIAGDLIDLNFSISDKEGHTVIAETFIDIETYNAPVFENLGLEQSTLAPNDTAHVRFIWQSDCEDVLLRNFKITFRIVDKPQDDFSLVTYKVILVKIVAPEPQWNSLELDLDKKQLTLEWQPYVCENLEVIEVWRRIDSYPYTPDKCETGLSSFLGYELIGNVTQSNQFFDNNSGQGLNPGATYCYRLLAVFQSGNNKIYSKVSLDTCIGPIRADAPVITHATIKKTSSTEGEARLSWRSPFEIDKIQFPPPYEYEVYRWVNDTPSKIHNGRIMDTTYLDAGINTVDYLHKYQVVVYAPSGITAQNPVDTSATATTVFLQSTPQIEAVKLSWDFEVPWSNNTFHYPMHYIYRRGLDEADFQLLDSVNVNTNGFVYSDNGSRRALIPNRIYVYKIATNGSYGNSLINEPLINFSQTIEAQPIDTHPPCVPTEIFLDEISCEEFINTYPCDFSDFSNSLSWNYSFECGDDVSHFNIYYAKNENSNFELLGTTSNNTFQHNNLPSFAGCYRISAIDRSGNESELSQAFCRDNCTSLFLPNVITPGNLDNKNDFFTLHPNLLHPQIELMKCPRFLKNYKIDIYNRWGKLVFSEDIPHTDERILKWAGTSNDGNTLPSGVYFYTLQAVFETLNPENEVQTFKGWVHLIY